MVSNLLIIHLGGECETNNNNCKFCEEKEEESDDMTEDEFPWIQKSTMFTIISV